MTALKAKNRFLLFFTGTLISLSCFSQTDSNGLYTPSPKILMPTPAPAEEIFYKGSVELGAGTIIPITNRALRLSFGGVYSFHLSVNYVLALHLFAGLEFEDSQLGNTAENAPYNTLMTLYNAGVKIGYYTYMQNDFLFCYSLSGGPSLITYSNAFNPAPRQQSVFITPDVLAGYRVNDELRIGVDVSVLILGYQFNPSYIGITQFLPGSYNPAKDNNTLTTCLGVGFGLYWAFDEGKK